MAQLPVTPLDPNRANVRITQFHGTPTGGLPTSTPGNYSGARLIINPGTSNVIWNVVNNYWAVTIPVTGFSGFYAHTTLYEHPLPISINYFTGAKQAGKHVLNWKVTCNSSPRVTMVLERSADGRNFTSINSISADALRCQQPFDYTDANPLKGINYYRLHITDADGKISYSSQVALLQATSGFEIVGIAPNPVVPPNLNVQVASAEAAVAELVIADMQGRVVQRQQLNLSAGFVTIPVRLPALASGSYVLYAISRGLPSKPMRFVVQ